MNTLPVFQKCHIKNRECQYDGDIRYEAFPEPVPEEEYIHCNYENYHQYDVRYHAYVFTHLPPRLLRCDCIGWKITYRLKS